MHTRVGASPAYVLSQLTTAVVGAACLVASVAFINSAKTALFQPVLNISSNQFAWMGALKLDVNHITASPNVISTPNLNGLVEGNLDQGLKKISKLQARAQRERKQVFARLSHVAHIRQAKLTEAKKRLVAAVDQIQVSQASTAPVAQVAQPQLPTEAEKLWEIHQALFKQFQLVMNETPPVQVNTQIVQAVQAPPAVNIQHQRRAEAKRVPPPSNRVDRIRVSASVETSPRKLLEEPVEKPVDTQPLSARLQAADRLAQKLEKMAGFEEVSPPPPLSNHENFRPVPVETLTTETPVTGASPDTRVQSPPPTPVNVAQVQADSHQSGKVEASPQTAESIPSLGGALILPPEYPKVKTAAEYPRMGVAAVNTQPAAATVPQILGEPTARPEVDPAPPHTSGSLMMMDTQAHINPAVAIPDTSYVEAFDWTHVLVDAQSEILTREDPRPTEGPSQMGWRTVRSADHWPTIFWSHPGNIPLLSQVSAKMLSLKVGATLQAEAGIVFAKAPAGWSVEFSGRSEHPLIFSESNQLLANDSVEQVRYYVFINASPGAQLLYLVKNGETGALALPVSGGSVSFADLSGPEKISVTGRLLDASGGSPRGISGTRIQLIGSGQTTLTNASGTFRFENVVAFGNQPQYIEAESSKGYPHRYKFNPKSKKLSLFVMGEESIHEWVGQLEGGISSESALVIGALPGLAAAFEDRKPLVSIHSLAVDPTLVPETYSMSPTGQLLVKTPMSAENSRLIGVQVPDGPAVVQLTDKDGKVLFSELLMVSPRVLSVVGPY